MSVLVGVLVALALTSCGEDTPPALQDVPGGGAWSAPASPPPAEVSDPIAISIPKIGARSDLIPLGLNPDGSLQVPPVDAPLQAGYYAGAKPGEPGDEVLPGQRGSAVVAAHVDGVIDGRRGQPGLFFKLHELIPGDAIFIDQADGGQLRFLVERVEQHGKDSFPSEEVFQADDMPRLNLVTCAGSFNRAAGHYDDNLVIFATLAPEQL